MKRIGYYYVLRVNFEASQSYQEKDDQIGIVSIGGVEEGVRQYTNRNSTFLFVLVVVDAT